MEESDREIEEQQVNPIKEINPIKIEDERKYWKEYLIKYFIYVPENCPKWGKCSIITGSNPTLLKICL